MRSVALFMHDFAGGGVERMRLALAAALTAAGCDVSIVVVNTRGPLATQIPASVKVFDLSSSRLLHAMPRLRRYLRDERPDVLVSSLDHNNIAAFLACATARTGTRLVICQHNALSEEVRLGWKYRVIPFLYRILAPRADAIVAVSNGVADDLVAVAGLHRGSITVIGNPVIQTNDLHALCPPTHPWMHDRSTPVFIFVGRLVAQKNPMMLIAAFLRHITTHRARLVILGDGPLGGEMRRAVKVAGACQHVHFAGFVSEPLPWIAHASALLLTSCYEGFANVIVEALACGTPVVATNCPYGPAEILADGLYGHLVPVNDTAAFAAAMETDLASRFPPAALFARAQDFTTGQSAANHLALFHQWPRPRTRTAFGLAFTTKTAHSIADQLLLSKGPKKVKMLITPNIDHVRLLRTSPAFQAACVSADTACADGWPVAIYASLRGAGPRRRITGCDILHELLSHPQAATRRIFAVVESHGTANILTEWLAARDWRHWAISVAPVDLTHDALAQTKLALQIAAFRTEILIMTLGAPVSEIFVHKNAHALPGCWAICVGQALRVEIGLTQRAPGRLRRLGLEWAWRCANEPMRLGPRYVRALLWFPYAAVTDFLYGLTPAAKAARSLPTRTSQHP